MTKELQQALDKLKLPVEGQLTHSSASRISEFQVCPRGFFYSNILGWVKEDRFHLDFGTAIHAGLEVMTANVERGYDDKVIAAGIRAFIQSYNENIIDANDGAPKGIKNGSDALYDYGVQYAADKTRYKCLYTEISGTVPIAEGRFLRFRLDALVEDKDTGTLSLWDHKTLSRLDKSWNEKWERAVQVQVYLLALHYLAPMLGLHPGNVLINGVQLKKPLASGKPNNVFVRVPVGANEARLLMAIQNLNHWWDQMQWNYDILASEKPEDPVMNAFPINGEACSRWPCKTDGLCVNWINPLSRLNHRPPGLMDKPAYKDANTNWTVNLGEDTELIPATPDNDVSNEDNDTDSEE